MKGEEKMSWSPPEVSYGRKYEKGLSAKEIAVKMREDIKLAKKSGALPADCRATVNVSHYANGRSINIRLRAMGSREMLSREYKEWAASGCPVRDYHDRAEKYTAETKSALEVLEAIRASYNYDGSDAMVDYFHVNYYGDTSIYWKVEHAEEEAYLRSINGTL